MARGAEGTHIRGIIGGMQKKQLEVIVVAPPGVDSIHVDAGQPVDKGNVRVSGIKKLWKFVSTKIPQWMFELVEIFYNIYAFLLLSIECLKFKPAFIYERYANFLLAGAIVSKLFKVPLLLEVNEVIGLPRARGLVLTKIALIVEKWVFKTSHHIYPVSSYLKDRITERIGQPVENKIIVIPNAVNDQFLNYLEQKKVTKKKLFSENDIVVGFVGWFDHWDRLDILIEVVAQVRQEMKNVVALIIGDGPGRTELQQEVGKKNLTDVIVFTGPIEKKDIFDYIDLIDIAFFPNSNVFGSPVALFELMAFGTAILCPKLMPFEDVVIDGENGLLFTPLNTDEMVMKLKYLCANKKIIQKFGENNLAKVKKMHTWDKNVEQILKTVGILEGIK